MAEQQRKRVRTHYRSLTPNGRVWCETSDPDEVRRMTHPELPLTFQRLDVYEASDGWQPWPVLPDHGDVDLLTVRWRALTEVRSSDPLHPDGSLMPPGPQDGVRHIIVRDGTMSEVAIAATHDAAVHIAEVHNAWM